MYQVQRWAQLVLLVVAKIVEFTYASGPGAESHDVSFTIEGRVLPFISTSDDEMIRQDTADIAQRVGVVLSETVHQAEEDGLQDDSDHEEEGLEALWEDEADE